MARRYGANTTCRAAGVARALMLLFAGVLVCIPAPTRAVDCPASLAGGPDCGGDTAGTWSPPSSGDRFVANPVDVTTGNKYERRVDYRAFGSRLALVRHYNSASADIDRGLGRGWRLDLDLSLMHLPAGSGLRIVQGDARALDFVPVQPQIGERARYRSTDGIDGDIVLANAAYVWLVPDGRRIEFPGVHPVRITYPDGERLELTWRAGRLVRIDDVQGRSIELEWTPGRIAQLDGFEPQQDAALAGHLEQVRLSGANTLDYRYDNRRRLRYVRYVGDVIERMEYAHDDLPGALSALTDERGTRQWAYGDEGRVTRFTERDGRTLDFDYRTLIDPSLPDAERGATRVQRKDGAFLEYVWHRRQRSIGGVESDSVALLRIVEHPCLDCAGTPRELPLAPADREGDASVLPIDGLRVERIDGFDARVRIEATESSFDVTFDRRARVERIDGEAVQRTGTADRLFVDELDSSSHVDTDGVIYRNANRTTDVCPIAIFRTCDELERDLEYANMSICAYAVNTICSVPGYEVLPPRNLNIPDRYFTNGNFRAVVFRNVQTNELVVAFRGTQSAGDLVADLNQYNGYDSRTYEDAQNLARVLDKEGYDITYTGHSLGGGLATAAALTSGEQAIGFNSAALTQATADRLGLDLADADHLATHLLVPGEIVGILQTTPMRDPSDFGRDDDYDREPAPWITNPTPGRRDVLEPPSPQALEAVRASLPWFSRALLSRNVQLAGAAHLMESVVASLNNTIVMRCGGHGP